ncbi:MULTISPECIES: GntR family transcriptional regulator [unclassified Caulobacter]|uniref:GntR family transcriptional regulator n=1 Tax=unclassified Caulobacter TaxID=2648921 RepID=UPI000D3B6042|nr:MULTISPECIES: GntR family transcriptional regulator [unclassified Caulobacter]PTS88945.1 GntR family transcriptional regulator [Caulobacter sp. HMWF009]PTT08346.1 GntR family transcriptional regulator [Caulobacter sp. HMWF025]
MKGPLNSVEPSGDWAPGLQKARIYELVLMDIILGELAPMQVLDEKVLASRYAGGVSGVRDALGRLAIEGLVLRRPRVGTVVAPLDVTEIEHAFEVRRMLEGRTAALAARNHRPEDLPAIVGAFDEAETAIAAGDFRKMLAMDHSFHRAVAFATHNPTLARFVIALQNTATRYWIWQMEKQSQEDQMRDVILHRSLAEAIARRDPVAAEAACAQLIGDPPSAKRS